MELNFIICFDEAFNEVSKTRQVDLVVRYFNNATHKGWLHYLSSSSTGHSTAENTMENFLKASSETKMSNFLQVSMYGTNVNRSFLEELTWNRKNHHDEFITNMLFHVSCGFHVMNHVLKTGHATVKSHCYCVHFTRQPCSLSISFWLE